MWLQPQFDFTSHLQNSGMFQNRFGITPLQLCLMVAIQKIISLCWYFNGIHQKEGLRSLLNLTYFSTTKAKLYAAEPPRRRWQSSGLEPVPSSATSPLAGPWQLVSTALGIWFCTCKALKVLTSIMHSVISNIVICYIHAWLLVSIPTCGSFCVFLKSISCCDWGLWGVIHTYGNNTMHKTMRLCMCLVSSLGWIPVDHVLTHGAVTLCKSYRRRHYLKMPFSLSGKIMGKRQ